MGIEASPIHLGQFAQSTEVGRRTIHATRRQATSDLSPVPTEGTAIPNTPIDTDEECD